MSAVRCSPPFICVFIEFSSAPVIIFLRIKEYSNTSHFGSRVEQHALWATSLKLQRGNILTIPVFQESLGLLIVTIVLECLQFPFLVSTSTGKFLSFRLAHSLIAWYSCFCLEMALHRFLIFRIFSNPPSWITPYFIRACWRDVLKAVKVFSVHIRCHIYLSFFGVKVVASRGHVLLEGDQFWNWGSGQIIH